MMDYTATSQARHWSFTPAHIATARESNRKRVIGKLKRAGPSEDCSDLPSMLGVDDEVLLQRCWHYKLQDMCREENAHTPERFTHRVMVSMRARECPAAALFASRLHHEAEAAQGVSPPPDWSRACLGASDTPARLRLPSDDGARLYAALLFAALRRRG
jgi:hypothetical protein